MNLPIPIFRNDINALGDFKGGVKVARDFAGRQNVTLFKTLAKVVDGFYEQNGLLDTISFQGHLWLVQDWQPSKNKGFRRPVRLVRPKSVPFQKPNPPTTGEDYFLTIAIPKGVLDGLPESENAEAFLVVADPDFEIPIPTVN